MKIDVFTPVTFLACPDFKGIKTAHPMLVLRPRAVGFWPALISKGLRPARQTGTPLRYLFLACPDFKGIKTENFVVIGGGFWFLACPDFKGIKTYSAPAVIARLSVSGLP